MTPARQEALLEEALSLVAELKDLPIYRLRAGGGGAAASGVPAFALGNALGFLGRERNLDRFREFVQGLHLLDSMVGQNQENPLGQHAALQKVLKPWLQAVQLPVAEVMYVLAWARRLLPKDSAELQVGRGKVAQAGKPNSPVRKPLPGKEEMSERRQPEVVKGGQMGAALRRALQQRKGK